MPWLEFGDGDGELVDLQFQRIMRRLADTPMRRYLRALAQYGEDSPYTEQILPAAVAYVLAQIAEAELELARLELEHPELLLDQEDE